MGRPKADRNRKSAIYWTSNGDTFVINAVVVNRTSRVVGTMRLKGQFCNL